MPQVAGDVTWPRLGPEDGAHATASEADAIIHSAALVNFLCPYEALRPTNVLSADEVIRLAFTTRIKPVHYISTAAVWPMGSHRTFSEADSIDHGELHNLAYDEAKWVVEKKLLHASRRGLPVAIYRSGEVGGDSRSEHFAIALFKGGVQLGAFPALDSYIDVTPVDYVAQALVHLACQGNGVGEPRVFHLTNPQPSHASTVYTWLRSIGYRFEELPFDD